MSNAHSLLGASGQHAGSHELCDHKQSHTGKFDQQSLQHSATGHVSRASAHSTQHSKARGGEPPIGHQKSPARGQLFKAYSLDKLHIMGAIKINGFALKQMHQSNRIWTNSPVHRPCTMQLSTIYGNFKNINCHPSLQYTSMEQYIALIRIYVLSMYIYYLK